MEALLSTSAMPLRSRPSTPRKGSRPEIGLDVYRSISGWKGHLALVSKQEIVLDLAMEAVDSNAIAVTVGSMDVIVFASTPPSD